MITRRVLLLITAGLLLLIGGLDYFTGRPWNFANTEQPISFEQVTVGEMQTNCYLLGSKQQGEGLIIDPGAEPDKILEKVNGLGWKVKYIVLTHGHFDHLGALDEVKKATGAEVLIHTKDAEMLTDAGKNLSTMAGQAQTHLPADRLLTEGDVIQVGDIKLKVFHTPGHTPGSIVLLLNKWLFAGDTLFKSGIGRTDLPGGSLPDLNSSIQNKLFTMPDATLVYPGHGPSTTIGQERNMAKERV